MQIAFASPVEIDTEILRLQGEAGQYFAAADRARNEIARIEKALDKNDTYAIHVRGGVEAMRDNMVILADEAVSADLRGGDMLREAAPYQQEWHDRGRWTRYYYVTSSNGHVHSSMACSTCHPTTTFAWLVDYSGMDEHEFVETKAKSVACTTCYSWAPVDVLRQKTVLELPERKAARLAKEAAKAEKAAKAAAKAITNPDGTPLHEVELNFRTGELRDGNELKTEIAANNAAMRAAFDLQWYNVVLADQGSSGNHPSTLEWTQTLDRCVAALAHKRGTTIEVEQEAINQKIAAKVKKTLKEN